MLELPSMWNLIISTIVFVIAAWYIRRYLAQQGVNKGITRGVLVFVLAYAASWAAGMAVDWVQEKIEGPQAATKTPSDLAQVLKALDQAKP